jgi:hypothetical protein
MVIIVPQPYILQRPANAVLRGFYLSCRGIARPSYNHSIEGVSSCHFSIKPLEYRGIQNIFRRNPMIKHVVMWKLKEVSECGDRLQNANKMKHDLEALRSKIPQIRLIEVGINAIPSEASYDIVLYSAFDSDRDLELYQKHPEHLKVAEFIAKIRERRVVVDYHTD